MSWFTNRSDFPQGYWNNKQNQRNFLDSIAKKNNIKEPKDWEKLTIHKLLEYKGGRALLSHHGNSLVKCLQANYPGFHSIWNLLIYFRSGLGSFKSSKKYFQKFLGIAREPKKLS